MNNILAQMDFPAVQEFFNGKENVASAFLFGSVHNGEVRPESDIDVAVLFNKTPGVKGRLDFYADLCDAFNSDKQIDMIVLNGAETILAFEAISGTVISNNKPEKTATFSSYISRLYEDTMANIEYQYSLRK